MADRRVQRREIMTGTGMMNDPEHLAELEERRHASELNGRLPPKTTFKQVMSAPPVVEKKTKRQRPVSKEKLRPSATNPVQRASAFFRTDEDDLAEMLGESREQVVVKA